ncbi:MAG: hypothetical protein APR53_08730 [Methanoculleus sp. SDB]|nr:MAG: hypothetical protein APR53_08730 [Methanoculleus sp. SDB]
MDGISGYIRMMRIPDWIKFYLLFPLAGAYCAGGFSSALLVTGLSFFCLTAYGFVVNNYYDVEIDRNHQGKAATDTNPLAAGRVSPRGTRRLMLLLLLVPAFLAISAGWVGWIFTALCAGALTLYSAEPFRLKDRLIVDIVTHGLMFGGLPVLAGFALAGGTPGASVSLVAALIATTVCMEALVAHQINDYAEDLGTARTTVVSLGRSGGWAVLFLCLMLSAGALGVCLIACTPPAPVLAALAVFLVLYPAYSCRHELATDTRRSGRRVIVSCLAFLR